ncbi:MAG: thioredoxin family protein [Bacteroidetes bacterium HGW-Bacteroidetes-11]|jgi:peroxiredoxin|nr:MAG: thioredoxin family protein [Bacteroidetes bacterium HGW-Bacteroidetes-11]
MKKTTLSILFSFFAIAFVFGQGYNVGDKASDFKLKNIDGKFVSMSDYADAKGFIVIFTCNHCPFSVAYEDRIIDIDLKYKELGYPVIAINPNDPALVPADSFNEMKKRSDEKGFTFPYLFDDGQRVFPVYGATRTPHIYLLNKEKDGLKVAYIGAIDNNHQDASAVSEKYLENAVNALIKGDKPAVDFTKAVGCTIKVASK